MKTDFHCHVLPEFDDGAKSIDESIAILKEQKQQGFDTVVATSHFYRNKETYEQFVLRRQKAYHKLESAVSGLDIPDIVLGAEVLFYSSIIDDEVDGLCISGTKFLLLEMPFYSLSKPELNLLIDFIESTEYKIIFAHIERYSKLYDKELYESVLSFDNALYQVNCDSFGDRVLRKVALKLIKQERVHIIGTDAHNMTSRPPLYNDAAAIINKKLGSEYLDAFHMRGEAVLADKSISKILSI